MDYEVTVTVRKYDPQGETPAVETSLTTTGDAIEEAMVPMLEMMYDRCVKKIEAAKEFPHAQ